MRERDRERERDENGEGEGMPLCVYLCAVQKLLLLRKGQLMREEERVRLCVSAHQSMCMKSKRARMCVLSVSGKTFRRTIQNELHSIWQGLVEATGEGFCNTGKATLAGRPDVCGMEVVNLRRLLSQAVILSRTIALH